MKKIVKHSLSSLTLLLATGVASHGLAQETTASNIKIDTKGGLQISTTDGDFSIKLGGRLQYDYNQADLNGITDEDDFGIRRARLYVSGDVKDWSYKIQYNIGNGNGGTPEDLYVRYNGWGNKAIVTVGRQKEPFGLNQQVSSKDITFLERSALAERYTPGRNDGVQLSGKDGNMTYAAGIFQDGGTDNTAFSGRFTYAPLKTDDSVVHLGVGYTDRGSDVSRIGLEVAGTRGPLHYQAEYVSSDNAGTDLDGYYFQVGWVITGETRPYSGGKFKRVKPRGNAGAWELVFRYEDGDGNYSDEELGRTDATTYGLGLNYYLNNYVRLGATYTEAKDNLDSDEGSEFRARIQFAF